MHTATDTPVIAQTGLSPSALSGKTAVVTGAGGGIGYEAARALLWLGCQVVVAEINTVSGAQAAQRLGEEFGEGRAAFIQTDVGDENSVGRLAQEATRRFGKVDIVINNATIAPLGLVKDVPITSWDASYRVNLRGPVLMALAFLPGMLQRNAGVFANVSSTGTAYMGAYETFKAAQVHLANTLDAELEGTGIAAFTIGPGLVPTRTAKNAIAKLAPQMGLSVEEFFVRNQAAVLTVEEAGAGFAVAVVLAEKFRGQEISSIQALKATQYNFGVEETQPGTEGATSAQRHTARELCAAVRKTLEEQSAGWKQRSIFERQWVIRDFKKTAGMPVEEWLEVLRRLEASLQGEGALSQRPPLAKLAGYYDHLAELAKGYERDPRKLEENLKHVYSWRDEVMRLEEATQV